MTANRLTYGCLNLLMAFCTLPGVAHADPITVTFESDSLGIKPNGFQSVESPLVRFSATGEFGALILARDFGAHEFIGSRGLAVFGTPRTHLLMDFLRPVTSLSLFFGNDSLTDTNPGDAAILLAFAKENFLVTTAFVPLNRNDIIDQSISVSSELGFAFDRAEFFYTADRFLAETVDNISFSPVSPVPEPATFVLAGSTLSILAARARRRGTR